MSRRSVLTARGESWRSKAVAARTIDDLWDAIAQAIDIFTEKECRDYFTASGYETA